MGREKSIKVTAVIPAYNEETTIGSVVLSARQHVLRVVVVDDGSTDRTVELAQLAGAQVISHYENLGKGAAMKTGFRAARDADIIVTLDSDAQHYPSDIPLLLEPILSGEADVVNGSRYLDGNDTDTPGYRRVGQNVLDIATNLSGGTQITDSQSGFRAFHKRSFPVFKFRSQDYSIESEMMIDASQAGLRIKEVDIRVRYGEEHQHKKNPVSHGLTVLVRLLRDMEFNRPLYYFGIPGLIILLIGVVFGFYTLSNYLGGDRMSIAPAVVAIFFTLVGTFISFTALILHSISRMIMRSWGK